MRSLRCRARRIPVGGFTLVELIVVLVIIAATAGLVIPAVAMMGRSTDMAVSADSQSAIANSIQQYFVLQKRYPQGMDSLLVDGPHGADTASTQNGTPDALYGKVSNLTGDQVSGLTDSNPNMGSVLAMSTLTANQVRSLTRGGLDYVFDHEGITVDGTSGALTGEQNANVSGKFRRALTSSTSQQWAVLRIPTADTSSTDQAANTILQRLVPGEVTGTTGSRVYTPETGTRLVAFGIGPNCRLVPTTMMNTPLYPGNDGKYYGRYIAVFKVFDTGERAVLVGVVDPYGRTPDYTQQQFNESLPNNGRQG
jgi:prepilin-type N-terminal cleavage/methylation domain-containing protein